MRSNVFICVCCSKDKPPVIEVNLVGVNDSIFSVIDLHNCSWHLVFTYVALDQSTISKAVTFRLSAFRCGRINNLIPTDQLKYHIACSIITV
eukprot:SAG11_NODE_3011_length_2766_cov_2.386577_5_plen_92_part_00